MNRRKGRRGRGGVGGERVQGERERERYERKEGRCRLYNDFITPFDPPSVLNLFHLPNLQRTAHTSAATIIDFD